MKGCEEKTQRFTRALRICQHGFSGTLAIFLLFLGTNPAVANDSVHPLHTITSAREAHDLSASEAVRQYPIHLHGMVTFYDVYLDPRQIILFVHDASGSMFVKVPPGTSLETPAGSVVDVQGVSGMGDFAPVLINPHVTLVGSSQLPFTAPQVTLSQLMTGADDGQWVEIEGVIHSVFEGEHDVMMQVAVRDGWISNTTPREPGRDYQSLVDAKVRIRANAGPLFNGDGQMIGARLMMPNLSTLQVLEAGPGNALDLPISSISGLSRYTTASAMPRRIHVRGRVTLAWPGSLLCVRDATHGLCAHSLQVTPLSIGDMVDLAGFAEVTNSVPSLSDAVFRKVSNVTLANLEPITATPVSADEALHGKHDSEFIAVEGQLLGRDLVASDTTLMLASDGAVYAVLLPKSMANAASAAWKNGSRLRVTGICSVELDARRSEREGGPAVRKSFRLLLRSPADVEVLQEPSWWTPAHTLVVLAVALMITLLVLGWVVVLTRRLKRQTSVIQESEEQFRHMAQHDFLTGLPTRLLLRDRLDSALEKTRRSKTSLALLMLDLDNFKQINDTLGHSAGDQALKVSAKRIVEAMRRSDTAARISGDEFIVLITDLVDPHEAELVAAKVVAALSAPFRVGDRDVPLSASVGICVASGGSLGADALLKRADIAMYHAKARGRNRFESYTIDMARATEENLLLQAGLRRALQANELEVYYQPMVSFQTGELTGFEALLRWRSKQLGMIMPEDFIPVAEKTGLITPLGEWVLRQACREIGMLEQQMGRSFLLAVNLSPRQIQQPDLPLVIERTLNELGRPPHLIEFEITENVLMKDSAMTHEALLKLRQLGVRLAIDDFGIGFSSLSYITKFSIDRIKIDRSFVSKCTREGGNLAVVRAMVAMAHGLSMQVVAEGVETAAEFRFLRDEGCDTAQGFYLSRPVPAYDLPYLMRQIKDLVESNATSEAMAT